MRVSDVLVGTRSRARGPRARRRVRPRARGRRRARGPPGAERDPYRSPEGYDYDYAPPRGAPSGPGSPWDTAGAPPGGNGPPGASGGGGGGGSNRVTNFLIAGAFVIGMGAGVAFDTTVDLEPANVASREILDRQTPSSEVCMANGASAMVFDQRVFMSLNPFNIYVAQPEVKPGCVLRRSNWSILEREKLVTGDQEADCKRSMNTFAFVGDLDKSPEVSCVYHSEEAENQFMRTRRAPSWATGCSQENTTTRRSDDRGRVVGVVVGASAKVRRVSRAGVKKKNRLPVSRTEHTRRARGAYPTPTASLVSKKRPRGDSFSRAAVVSPRR